MQHHLALTLTLTFTVGCALDPNAADEHVSTETSALLPMCPQPPGTWCREAAPVPTMPALHAVWAVDASNVFAVGEGGTIWRRGVSVWTVMSSGTTQTLNGVWAASSSDVWAVGGAGTILRFNGTSWSAVAGATLDLTAIWGSSANDVWLTGSGLVLHYNGTTFSTSGSFAGLLTSISGTGPTDVWATGELTNVHHFNGIPWSTSNLGVGTSTFKTVLAIAPGDVWVTDSTPMKESVHLTGGTWVPKSTMGGVFNSLAAFGANDMWGVGGNSRVGHWDGSMWTTGMPLGSVGALFSVTKAPGNVWAVGDSALIAHRAL